MKNLFTLCVLLIGMSCSGDDSNSADCPFVGEWCTEDPLNAGNCWTTFGLTLEFRENGELVQNTATFLKWESDDCMTINIFHDVTGDKVQEYEVISVTEDRLVINIGTETEYIRAN